MNRKLVLMVLAGFTLSFVVLLLIDFIPTSVTTVPDGAQRVFSNTVLTHNDLRIDVGNFEDVKAGWGSAGNSAEASVVIWPYVEGDEYGRDAITAIVGDVFQIDNWTLEVVGIGKSGRRNFVDIDID